jgi:hypothetical protein
MTLCAEVGNTMYEKKRCVHDSNELNLFLQLMLAKRTRLLDLTTL